MTAPLSQLPQLFEAGDALNLFSNIYRHNLHFIGSKLPHQDKTKTHTEREKSLPPTPVVPEVSGIVSASPKASPTRYSLRDSAGSKNPWYRTREAKNNLQFWS